MLKVYRCDYCWLDFFCEEECKEHESNCNQNPKTRACQTCIHHREEVADTGKVWFACKKGLVPTDGWKNNFMKNCEGWD